MREAGAVSVMGAYNRTNGEPCCASPTLLGKILRDEWGFEGYVVSDCWAIGDIYKHHKVVGTLAEAAALAVKAGCDLNCGEAYAALLIAERKGLIDEATIDRAVRRLFTARFRLGMFDPPERVPYARLPISVNDSPEHRALALRAGARIHRAAEEHRRSPAAFKRDPTHRRHRPERRRSVGAAGQLQRHALQLCDATGRHPRESAPGGGQYTRGCDIIDEGVTDYAAAIRSAERADVVLFFAGISQRIEGEEGQEEGVGGGMRSKGDRTDINLPVVQEDLLKVLHATGKPIVLVLLERQRAGGELGR